MSNTVDHLRMCKGVMLTKDIHFYSAGTVVFDVDEQLNLLVAQDGCRWATRDEINAFIDRVEGPVR